MSKYYKTEDVQEAIEDFKAEYGMGAIVYVSKIDEYILQDVPTIDIEKCILKLKNMIIRAEIEEKYGKCKGKEDINHAFMNGLKLATEILEKEINHEWWI